MSQSSDDPRRPRPPGPTQRTPAVRPFGHRPETGRQDVAPPPPRARPLDWDDVNADPNTTPPARRVHPDDLAASYSLDFEPSPLRAARPRDIEPPLDDPPLEDAWRQVMTQPPGQSLRQPPQEHIERPEPSRIPERGRSDAPDHRAPDPRASDARSAEVRHAEARAPQARPVLSAPSLDDELTVHDRDGKVEKAKGLTPIVQAGTVTGRSLTLVIVIMSFLACLTAGAVYLIHQSANAWLRDIATEVTVQVEARDKNGIDRTLADVGQLLKMTPGVRAVKPLSDSENAQLLEPWLGGGIDVLKELPVPRLIAIEVDRVNPPNFDALRAKLAKDFTGVTLDDHRHWQRQIRTVTRSFALGGLAILLLVGAATTAIIVSATRSALSANREIVEVLHFVGATDKFIAREFAGHFLSLGIRAGIVGAGAAMLMFFLLPFGMEAIGGGAVTMAELRRLIGAGTLDVAGYLILLSVVVVIAALCMLTSRIGVYRILNSQH